MYVHKLLCCFKWSIYHVCHVCYMDQVQERASLKSLPTETPDSRQTSAMKALPKIKNTSFCLKKRKWSTLRPFQVKNERNKWQQFSLEGNAGLRKMFLICVVVNLTITLVIYNYQSLEILDFNPAGLLLLKNCIILPKYNIWLLFYLMWLHVNIFQCHFPKRNLRLKLSCIFQGKASMSELYEGKRIFTVCLHGVLLTDFVENSRKASGLDHCCVCANITFEDSTE